MYSARDRLENEEWIADLQAAADRLDLGPAARSCAEELFLSNVPDSDRSKRATLAASVYAGTLVAGEERSQGEVADAMDVSRLTVQTQWKDLIESAGLDAPDW